MENEMISPKTNSITGFHLKLIATISMFIDHFAAVVVWGSINASYGVSGSIGIDSGLLEKFLTWIAYNRDFVWTVYETLRLIGRIAFPIYCFLIVEGFLHTKNVAKYALRLGIFAVISEIPFDLAFSGIWWESAYNNVFLTLVIGLLVIWGLSYVLKFHSYWMEQKWDGFIGKVLTIGAGTILIFAGGYTAEYFLNTDYGAAGVVTIVIMYILRKMPWLGFFLAVLALTAMTNSTEIIALVGLVPMCYYNGERGKNIKYFFYAFYPVHLLLLWLVTVAIGV